MEQAARVRLNEPHPLLLNTSHARWLIETGGVDLFLVSLVDGVPTGARDHLCRLAPGQILRGLDNIRDASLPGLLAVALPDTQLQVLHHTDPLQMADWTDDWLMSLTHNIQGLRPRDFNAAIANSHHVLHADAHLSLHQGVLWIVAEQPDLEWLPAQKILPIDLPFPLTPTTWLRALTQTNVRCCSSRVLGSLLEKSVAAFHHLLLQYLQQCRQYKSQADSARLMHRQQIDTLNFHAGLAGLVQVLHPSSSVALTAQASELAKFDLAFTVPQASEIAARLPNHALSLVDLLRFGLRGSASDLYWLLLTGALAGMCAIAMPLSVGFLVDDILPTAQPDQLRQLVLFVLAAVLGMSAFGFASGLAVIRISGRASYTLQSALMDRLLHLPPAFFRQYAAGDLAQRLFGMTSLMQAIAGSLQTALLGWLFGLFSYAMLFWISIPLALLATVLVLGAFVLTGGLNFWRLKQERQITQAQASMTSRVFQILNGIQKIRIAGAEKRVFTMWAKSYAEQKKWRFLSRRLSNSLSVFDAAYGVVCSLLLFAVVGIYLPAMATGSLLIFLLAFNQFFASSLALAHAVSQIADVIPLLERARPILQALPERYAAYPDPGELTGAIELSHLRFRYHAGGPLILNDVSISIAAGQFIAIVGPSGAGKSTLLRLLLGFEQCEAGAVFYDDQNLTGLDVLAVRRQMGVVLQSGKLMAGDIFSNIIGATGLTLDDAWQAARMAGLADDIAAMPMGMHTVITESAGTLSGGQKQRLLIARAMLRKPRILLLDEATSALDHQTQRIVADNIAQLGATRIVIAHRLSSVVQADCIFYLERGHIVERGTYAELMALQGAFAAMAQRQLV